MDKRRIYKFQDDKDFDSAYVVATSRDQAESHLMGETELNLIFIECRDIENFPKADLNRISPYIWKSDIKPF